ncbi:MAG: F0F1 ATP synthase subunit B [Candidatus Levybacteria bacterium]|nr:F0F1 ATP synthase subunit B [Candidatus Levybacteria bacterium]MBI2189963.1 F0F1 ATP synthase subunit B [Candidatus Levybacteria bacterium]MBI2622666.1 F0F1 ATP synthase subunit B [Candidatus Levybacteria bacterium]MBI3069887.1 F0F1 ATP synthase subunit B [Candidatus Levybacteria bacterium]MBI3093223.1 F0F1 ATP synthase subunit B [Candidatus Levybacteria bacterium]
MELIKNFGLDPFLLGAQVVNFLIILYLLKRFLYKPILDLLKNRETVIKDGLQKAQEAVLLLEKTKEEEKRIIKNAQAEAKKLLENAKIHSLSLTAKLEESSKKQAERILLQAKAQIEQETRSAEERLMSNVSRVAMQFLQKSVSQLFDKKDQEEVMKKAIEQLKKTPN